MSVNKKNVQIGLGISSILMIFVVLCMTILATLTYREATLKMDVTKRQKEYQEQYTKADASIQFLLAKLQDEPYDTVGEMIEQEKIQTLCKELSIEIRKQGEQVVVSVGIYNEQRLEAKLRLLQNKLYIDAYQIVT